MIFGTSRTKISDVMRHRLSKNEQITLSDSKLLPVLKSLQRDTTLYAFFFSLGHKHLLQIWIGRLDLKEIWKLIQVRKGLTGEFFKLQSLSLNCIFLTLFDKQLMWKQPPLKRQDWHFKQGWLKVLWIVSDTHRRWIFSGFCKFHLTHISKI